MSDTITVTRLAIRGFTGDEPKPEYAGEGEDRRAWLAARYYNKLAPITAEGDKLSAAFDAARATAAQLWEALATTSTDQWLAAHHRWVLAEAAVTEIGDQVELCHRSHRYTEDGLTLSDHTFETLNEAIRQTPGTDWPGGVRAYSDVFKAREQRNERERLAGKTAAHATAR
ncbi:hypothetical protein ACGF07_31955 [Kitasatospora sp. NPDC048194]|uniref:hypothetical protein n=1 Tax=Kitasatospora sp. NPDC048194 TaxID=3364045 RepID=UPI00370FAAD1